MRFLFSLSANKRRSRIHTITYPHTPKWVCKARTVDSRKLSSFSIENSFCLWCPRHPLHIFPRIPDRDTTSLACQRGPSKIYKIEQTLYVPPGQGREIWPRDSRDIMNYYLGSSNIIFNNYLLVDLNKREIIARKTKER